jgi:type IV pilus assembly protein PilX
MSKQMKSRRYQSGAALYIALIMLILMALIGIVAMQVASLQERMSANYQAGSMAFQNAESGARDQEITLKNAVSAGSAVPTDLPPLDCKTTFDAEGYTGAAPHVRRLDLCFSWGGLDYPADESEKTDQIFQITAFAKDRTTFASSESVIDTVFIP